MKIGSLKIDSPYFLAPLAGYTDVVFRSIVRQFNCGVIYTEMVSAAGLARSKSKTQRIIDITPDDHPVAIQLFGAVLEDLARAVPRAEEAGADLIDINFGCPVPKVVKQGAGSALMREPEKVQAIIKTVVGAAKVPVTVKFRSGWSSKEINVVDLSKVAEGEGVSAICVHARTRSQGFSGLADWSVIRSVKAAVSVPVIGNGDVHSQEDADRMQKETGCEFVMIGRGAVQFFIPEEQRIEKLREHLRLFAKYKGEKCLQEMRKFAPFYAKGLKGAGQLRKAFNVAKTLDEYEAALDLAE
ncbi:MAG: tRNA-dihydrouridine synthase [Candidatus Margulisiibacteriota bacterium]